MVVVDEDKDGNQLQEDKVKMEGINNDNKSNNKNTSSSTTTTSKVTPSNKKISIINANSKKPITTSTSINTTKQLTYKL